MSEGPVIERKGNNNIHNQVVGAYLRRVGPRETEFDWTCFMLKVGRLYLIWHRYVSGRWDFRLQWWPKRGPVRPARTLLSLYGGRYK